MSSKHHPVIDIGTDNAINYTIPELVSYLKSTFVAEDFERVKQILLAKEEKMKKEASMEMRKVKKELDSVEENHGEMALSKLIMEDELKASKRECEQLREQVLRLKEEKRGTSDREVRSEERHMKFVEEVKKQEDVQSARLVELQCMIKDLERGKRSAEALVELYKCRFEDLGSRVSRLEEDTIVLTNEQPLVSNRVGEEFRAANAQPNEGPRSSQKACSTETKEEDDPPNYQMKLGRLVITKPACEAVSPSNRMVSPVQTSGGHASGGVIDIIDSDDEPMGDNSPDSALKRKRASPCGGGDDDGGSGGYGFQFATQKMKQPQELILKEKYLHGKSVETADIPKKRINSGVMGSCKEKFRSKPKSPRYTSDIFLSKIESCDGEDSSSDSESEDDANADDWLLSKIERNLTTSWKVESDLISSLEKDPKLCMRAVCALYREKFFKVKPFKGLELPGTQNIEKSDALRGAMLAELLIDGDPEGKLKKSIPELQKQDPRGLDDCKRLATRYSMKLFEIYKKWGDPLFHPIFAKLQ